MDPRPTIPVVLAAVAAVAAVALVAGCGGSSRDDEVKGAVERFNAAFERHDGKAACAELSEDASSELEKTEKKPCEEAILSLEVEPSLVDRVEVHVVSGEAELAGGGAVFLDDTSDGWKISALGCKPEGKDKPYDCELEA